jgi:hypothetical protein
MIIGAHSIVYSRSAEADRAFLRDVLGLPHVDAGEGWLIFGLPPAEVAVHPHDGNDRHELYLMCEDVNALVANLARRNVACTPIQNQGWGLLTHVSLPGGGKLGVYQPRHARPKSAPPARKAAPRAAKRATKKKRAQSRRKAGSRKKARRR